ncbi:Protein GRIP, partial [Zostera marina]
ISRLESDFSSYKVRAHALLQKKDAELHAAKDNDIINAQEEAIREAEREVAITLEEKDKALQDLQNALNSHDKEITARELALDDAEQRAKSFSLKLNSAKAQYQTEKEAWQKNLDALEENWRLKYSALEVQKNENSGIDLQSKLKDVMQEYKKLKEEHETFRDIADRMLEEKENEISKFLKENNTLRKTSKTGASVNYIGNENKVVLNDDVLNSDIAAAEQQILILARQQAQREDELTQSQRHIMALQEEIVELERENRLHSQQEAMLKEEVRNVERNHKREGVDMTYLKNVILKLLETGEVDALLPVVGTLLQFSPNEMKKCQQTYRVLNDASLSSAATPPESLASTTSLFSRFSFT